MPHDRQTQAKALREMAQRLEEVDDDLPDDVVGAVEEIVDWIWVDEAVRDWRAREAAGEKTIPSAEVRRILGY